jgi:hypothetical protein
LTFAPVMFAALHNAVDKDVLQVGHPIYIC